MIRTNLSQNLMHWAATGLYRDIKGNTSITYILSFAITTQRNHNNKQEMHGIFTSSSRLMSSVFSQFQQVQRASEKHINEFTDKSRVPL